MTIASCGTGDEKAISEMTDEELLRERDFWNNQLKPHFYSSSGKYDVSAILLREIERELNRREHDGPPWAEDEG